MDKYLASYELLVLMAMIDREFHHDECDVIYDFYSANVSQIRFDFAAVAQSLAALTYDGQIDELVRVAKYLNDILKVQEKLTVLQFAKNVIYADGFLRDEELRAFSAVGTLWQIDLPHFIRNY